MIVYTTGDLLLSSADALVNTVNCEGYMGKGIAYQFKLKYPENNIDYVKACKNGSLIVGKLHYFHERGKIIINFPTKDKWRANSKMEYIVSGLNELVILIRKLNIKSIAIPPLGSGNGGLLWAEVKPAIEQKLSCLSDDLEIFVYEPSHNYVAQPTLEPKLSLSALVLMKIKNQATHFNTLRLQKTAYFIDVFSGQNYFNFKRYKYGPYDNSISIISKNIKEYQKYHNVQSTNEAYTILYNKIISDSVSAKLEQLESYIKLASDYVNSIVSDHELECISTIVFLIREKGSLSDYEVVNGFKSWSEEKANKFSEQEVLNGIKKLYADRILEKTLTGYIVPEKQKIQNLQLINHRSEVRIL